ncbi:MAG: STAS domain-containing protein [Chloroflexi bacterium]|nr:STAS domain-containing protein [Chloroflexota bacterium]MCY3638346.1 STAS domain-containing protein [Chloroflexota bacterium]
MKVNIEREGDILVAMVEDRVDGTNAGEFQQALEADISESDRIVILDCEGLSYISSAGLRVVLLTARALQKQNSKFAICSLSEQIREVFEISGFDKIIPVHPNRTAAVEALGD